MRLLVQAVGARVRWQYDRAWGANEDKKGRLVVIAEHDDIVRSSVEAELLGWRIMHVVFREAQGLEETEIPMDLGQTPADLVVLSFSDSDLGLLVRGGRRRERACHRFG